MEEKKLYNAVQKFITLADGREIMIETGEDGQAGRGHLVVKQWRHDAAGDRGRAKDAKPTRTSCLQVEYKEK